MLNIHINFTYEVLSIIAFQITSLNIAYIKEFIPQHIKVQTFKVYQNLVTSSPCSVFFF